MSFHLEPQLIKLGSNNVDIPEKHKFIMSDIRQTMGVFSETPAGKYDFWNVINFINCMCVEIMSFIIVMVTDLL